MIVCNPPYGERLLEKQSAEELYRQMHGIFSRLDGWSVNIIASHPDFERIYGARADKRRKLSNGGMTCTLYRYRPHYLSPKPERPKTGRTANRLMTGGFAWINHPAPGFNTSNFNAHSE